MGSLRKISRAHVEAMRELILAGGPSDSVDLPDGWRAERKYNLFRLAHERERIAAARTAPRGILGCDRRRTESRLVEAAGFKFEASTIAAAGAPMPDNLSVATFDAAKIADTGLVARNFMQRRPDAPGRDARHAQSSGYLRRSQAAARTARALSGRDRRRHDRVAPGSCARAAARSYGKSTETCTAS